MRTLLPGLPITAYLKPSIPIGARRSIIQELLPNTRNWTYGDGVRFVCLVDQLGHVKAEDWIDYEPCPP